MSPALTALAGADSWEPFLRSGFGVFLTVCVVWGFLKGAARVVLTMLAAACGGAAAWGFFRYAPGPVISALSGYSPAAVNWGAAACGLAVFWFSRRFLTSFLRGGRLPGAGLRSGLLSVLPALALVWGGAMAIRWAGSVASLRWVQRVVDDAAPAALADPPIVVRLFDSATTGTLGRAFDRVDPLHAGDAAAVGALLVVQRSESAWRTLQRQPGVDTLFARPPVRRLLRNHDVTRALSFAHYSALLTLPELTAAVRDPDVRGQLRALPVRELVQASIAGAIVDGIPPRATVID